MLWLLSSCIATSRNGKAEEGESRCKLGSFVMTMSLDVIFNLRQDGRSALHTACLVGDYYFVKLLTEKIKEENIQEQFCLDFHCGDLGWSPLHYAAAAGWNDVVELLLASRCDFEFEEMPITLILYFFANLSIAVNSSELPLLDAINKVSFF